MLEGDNGYKNRQNLRRLGMCVVEIEAKLQLKWIGKICFINKPTSAQILEMGLGSKPRQYLG